MFRLLLFASQSFRRATFARGKLPNVRIRGILHMKWQIYLAGEIHSDWREAISTASREAQLPVVFYGPQTDHESSDECGVRILGEEAEPYWRDHKGASINAIRTQTLIQRSDVIVVRFGDKYRQWNAAFDAGYAAALGKPVITLHASELDHALKEVDAAALAVAREPAQVVEAIRYVTGP